MKRSLMLVLAALVALPALALDRPTGRTGDDKDNLRFIITISDSDPGDGVAEHSVQALLLDGDGQFLTGWGSGPSCAIS